ncbi:GNAT family N-acetyltransferase [Neolewinella persica]|uniref:GNAT family N-acetyltransferase n=1 Tax=Neolewinella persica TaxID=70998 RepID=UPI00035EE2FC|nr:GNAT family N-acetyltransferase [Neolewinella persica]
MIRPLTPDDTEAFIALRYEAFTTDPLSWDHEPGTPIDPEVWRPRIAEVPGLKFVLGYFLTEDRETPELAGILGFTRYEKPKRRHRAMLWGVYVSPAARGRNAGGQLLEETLRRARQLEGLERVTLTVSHLAPAALHLYRKAGFVEYGREPGAARTGKVRMDEIYMLLEL